MNSTSLMPKDLFDLEVKSPWKFLLICVLSFYKEGLEGAGPEGMSLVPFSALLILL